MTDAAFAEDQSERVLIEGYRRSCGANQSIDEVFRTDGQPQSHWTKLFASLSHLHGMELSQRAERLDARVRETGIAYDIFSDPTEPSQPWQLDIIPVVVSRPEWRWLEKALCQRAHLFAGMLQDLYGEKTLLRSGIVPPDLVFSDDNFLRPCESTLPSAKPLTFYAADVARGADGLWRIIDNHTETIAGIGFALANRVAHTHVAGDLFKQNSATRLASYFEGLQAALQQMAGRESARIALLTPGPHHQDYFSHAYLARYLGLLLVEGSDLRTKGNGAYLKTLEGLKEIDLIVRCVDGRIMDPLELDPTGFGGPPGLLRVNRTAPDLVANAIGTALTQNRGLSQFLPAICQHLLSEDLILHDTPRLWLGDESAKSTIINDADNYIIRSTQDGTGRPGQTNFGRDLGTLNDNDRTLLLNEMNLFGSRLVAEERSVFSTAPSLQNGTLVPKPFAMRVFISRQGDDYHVMRGALAISIDPERAIAPATVTAHTRDVWVPSDTEQQTHTSLWRPKVESARIDRSQRVIQSRVADDLFWLGRYGERADWIMRVLRSTYRRMEEDSGPATGLDGAGRCVQRLLIDDDSDFFSMPGPVSEAEFAKLCRELTSKSASSRSLPKTFAGLYRTAQLARDRLSLEAWQALSLFRPNGPWSNTLAQASNATILDELDRGIAAIAAFNGLMHENMTRNFGWRFLDMGRRLERAYNLSEMMLSLFIPAPSQEQENSWLLFLLEVADSFITYRSRYRLDPMLGLVLDLLLLDESNPRSLGYQLAAISKHLDKLPSTSKASALPDHKRIILNLSTSTRLAEVMTIAEPDHREELGQLLREQLVELPELSDAISRYYFNFAEEAPHRVQTRVGR